jgi:hypothetical protein
MSAHPIPQRTMSLGAFTSRVSSCRVISRTNFIPACTKQHYCCNECPHCSERAPASGVRCGSRRWSARAQNEGRNLEFQADKHLPQIGRLDTATMRDLHHGGTASVPTAATSLGSHTKEAAHDIKTGHPVEAGKTLGSGAAGMGKSVGHERKSVATKGGEEA